MNRSFALPKIVSVAHDHLLKAGAKVNFANTEMELSCKDISEKVQGLVPHN